MDTQLRMSVSPRFEVAPVWGLWGAGFGDLRQASEILLGLTCLFFSAVIIGLYARRRRPPAIPSRGISGMMGACLVVCGFAQLASALAAVPAGRAAGAPVVAAVACWAAALTMAPKVARVPVPLSLEAEDFEREIAERMRAQEALRNSEAEARKLTEAAARKNEFLAMLGHELRNPLAPIRNAVKIMKQLGSDDPDLCWARDVVDHQVRHMGQLVDDLLEISRVTSGKVRLHKEPVVVATILAFAVETSRPIIDSHRHRLSIIQPDKPIWVDADQIRMAQVLSNLMNNAAKFTEPGGQIRLAVALEGEWVVFRVRDNGMGIPAEMLSHVFDLFTQGDRSLDRSQGGLGLGLTLVRSLVEMHGGTVQALSQGLNRGSEFLVRLPVLPEDKRAEAETAPKVCDAATPRPAPGRSGRPPQTSRRVLVVDDNVSVAQSLATILKYEGYDVRVSHDGVVALEAVQNFRPEAVLMDIGLPGMDGYEVARRLHQQPELGQGVSLLVAVTGYAEDEARRRSREAGFDHHLVKPIDPDALLALLASLEWAEQPGEPGPFAPSRGPAAGPIQSLGASTREPA